MCPSASIIFQSGMLPFAFCRFNPAMNRALHRIHWAASGLRTADRPVRQRTLRKLDPSHSLRMTRLNASLCDLCALCGEFFLLGCCAALGSLRLNTFRLSSVRDHLTEARAKLTDRAVVDEI